MANKTTIFSELVNGTPDGYVTDYTQIDFSNEESQIAHLDNELNYNITSSDIEHSVISSRNYIKAAGSKEVNLTNKKLQLGSKKTTDVNDLNTGASIEIYDDGEIKQARVSFKDYNSTDGYSGSTIRLDKDFIKIGAYNKYDPVGDSGSGDGEPIILRYDLKNIKLVGVADPTQDNHASNKKYTDERDTSILDAAKKYTNTQIEEILLGSQVGKSSISILFVGNSLTQDGIAYLPYILKNYYPEIDFRIYMWYVGGYTLEQQYDKFISDGVADVFSVAENSESWTNYRKDTTMSSVLSSYRFDIVCMQEYFNYKTEYTAATDWNNCRDYIVSNYQGGNALEFISLFHAPLRKEGYDVHEVYEMTERGNALILQDTISEDMIPNGIAVYRALDTELNNLGDLGQLSPDGTHTQEGLPCLLQTYVTLCWLFDRLRINKSIYGHPMRMTTAIYNTISVPGANLGTGVVQGTDAQYLLAQEVAIKAYKEGKQFVTRNLYPYEWGGGSALIQCTFSITTNISGATIKINGIEQSSVVVLGGSTVNWEVSKDGYETQRGSETIGSDTTRSVELMPIVSVTSISAEFNQGERTIFDEQDLDDLREYLVVHVNYVDGTRKETDAYTLSGTLTDGANTITVSFGGKETTFVVEVRSVVIPEGVTRYGWVAYYKDSSPASSELKTPSNFIYLNAYEDMNELSAEFTIGKKPNVNVVSGPALLGARLSSSSNTRPWYGIYVPAELGGLRVDIRNHAGAEFIPWPSDVNKFKLVIDNRSTSPAYAYTNEHETGVELPWTTSDVIPYGMSLFNNIPNGSTSNMGFNHVFRLGDIIFRDYGGKCVGYYVPAVSEGKIGMFDIITQTFCTAQTTSVVTVGNSDCIYKVGNW